MAINTLPFVLRNNQQVTTESEVAPRTKIGSENWLWLSVEM